MINQRQGLKNILESIESKHLRVLAVCNWLTDINWHTEARILSEIALTPAQKEMQENLQTVDYVLNPHNYCDEFINHMEIEHPEIRKNVRKQSNGYVQYNDYIFSRSQLFDFRTAQSFHKTFNLIFGYGLDNDWNCTHGDLLVADLVNMLTEVDKI